MNKRGELSSLWEKNKKTVCFQCVERLDLAGMDFIWRIAMETPDEEIANEAIQLIITYSYTNLNPKMKKVSAKVFLLTGMKNKARIRIYSIIADQLKPR